MSRKARIAPDLPQRRRRYIWIIAGTLVILGGLGAVLFFRILPLVNHSEPDTGSPIQPPRTAPDLVIQQFCADLMSNNYTDAYTLLSSVQRKQLDSLGGAQYWAMRIQQLTGKYGAIVSCQITNVTKNNATLGSNQATILVQIQRQNFQANQSETDQFDLILEPEGWAVNKWTNDIGTT